MQDKTALLIMGPHRSGTSVVTNGIACMGFGLGTDLLEANDDNPRGFFESKRIVALNDKILFYQGLCWDYIGAVDVFRLCYQAYADPECRALASAVLNDLFSDQDAIAIKDPRLCLLAPFWRQMLRDHGYQVRHVLVVRHPLESAASQARRYRAEDRFHFIGQTLDEGVYLWSTYLLAALQSLENSEVCVIDYDRFLADPGHSLEPLRATVGAAGKADHGDLFDASFVDKSLKRNDRANLQAHPGSCDYTVPEACYETTQTFAADPQFVACALMTSVRGRLEALLEQSRGVAEIQQKLFVRARNMALQRAMSLAEQTRQMERATAIIKYNESLIKELEAQMDEGTS